MKIDVDKTALGDKQVAIVTLTNSSGASVKLSSLGAGILEINVPNKNGKIDDVVMGYDNIADYDHDGPCCGKTPGRYANRIGAGRLIVDGREYRLAVNCGPNHLHGGPEGFQNRVWDCEVIDDTVVFSYLSRDGEENYPGNLHVKVTYRWSEENALDINYEATTDKPTVVNLTNHTYFNLSGHNHGNALEHYLWLNSHKALEVDCSLNPTGKYLDVKGTPFDFTTAKQLKEDMDCDFEPLRFGKGYDHCFIIDDYEPGVLSQIAVLSDHQSGRTLEIFSDQPGVQLYTGNWLTGSPAGKGGYVYTDYSCVALECQGLPDAPNHPEFPSQTLYPGEKYLRTITYQFS